MPKFNLGYSGGRALRGPVGTQIDARLSVYQKPQDPVTTQSTHGDLVLTTSTSNIGRTRADVSIVGTGDYAISVENPAIATVNGNSVDFASAGSTNILVSKGKERRFFPAVFSENTAVSTTSVNSILSNSLARVMTDGVKSRFAGVSRTDQNKVRLTSNSGQVAKNMLCPVSDIDLSCYSYSTSNTSEWWTAIAISPIHFITAAHTGFMGDGAIGTTVNFLGVDGVTYSASISGGNTLAGTDIGIGRFSSPLPPAVVPAKVFPSSFNLGALGLGINPMPSKQYYNIPVIYYRPSSPAGARGYVSVGELAWFRQNFGSTLSASAQDWLSNPNSTVSWFDTLSDNPLGLKGQVRIWSVLSDIDILPWGDMNVWTGSSSSPCFAIVENSAVLLGCFHTADAPYGVRPSGYGTIPLLSELISDINAWMAALNGGSTEYQLQTFDISSYSAY